jgi:hypothetical protein
MVYLQINDDKWGFVKNQLITGEQHLVWIVPAQKRTGLDFSSVDGSSGTTF